MQKTTLSTQTTRFTFLSIFSLVTLLLCSLVSFTGYSQFTWKNISNVHQPSNNASNLNIGDVNNMYADFKQYYIDESLYNNTEARPKWGSGGLTEDDSYYTASEGMGYAMLMAAYAEDQDLFAKLWKFYERCVDEDAPHGFRLMPWLVKPDGTPLVQNAYTASDGKSYGALNGDGPATDGDIDVAMALLIAHEKWGGNYKTEAVRIIDYMREHYIKWCDQTGIKQWVIKPYGWTNQAWDACTDEHDYSYYISAYFRVFAQVATPGTDPYNGWEGLANQFYGNKYLGRTDRALPGDWSFFPGITTTTWRAEHYASDSSRIPWRVALDYIWNQGDSSITNPTSNWMDHATSVVDGTIGGIANVQSDIKTSGYNHTQAEADADDQINIYNSMAFSGGFAVGAMSHSLSKVNEFSNNFKGEYYSKRSNSEFDLSNGNDSNDYYGLATAVLYGITLSGNFIMPDVNATGGNSGGSSNGNFIANGTYTMKTVSNVYLKAEAGNPNVARSSTSLDGDSTNWIIEACAGQTDVYYIRNKEYMERLEVPNGTTTAHTEIAITSWNPAAGVNHDNMKWKAVKYGNSNEYQFLPMHAQTVAMEAWNDDPNHIVKINDEDIDNWNQRFVLTASGARTAKPTTIAEATSKAFKVYPNPTSSQLNIDLSGYEMTTEASAMIFDLSGRMVQEKTNLEAFTTISVDALPTGSYMILINTGSETMTHRINRI